MTKLNDTQRTILAAAGARETSLVLPFPKSLKLTLSKAAPVIQSMIDSGLVLERIATDGEAIWRTDDEIGKLTIVATAEGLRAVGIEPPTVSNDASADRSRRRVPSKPAAPSSTLPRSKAAASAQTHDAATPPSGKATPRPTTKLGILTTALCSKKGATIDDLTTATGWQPHSVRGAISGALKRKQGLNVTSTAVDGRGRVYRIVE